MPRRRLGLRPGALHRCDQGSANAALDSLHPRFAVAAHLADLLAANGDVGEAGAGSDEEADTPVQLPIELTDQDQAELTARATARHAWIERAGRPNRDTTSGTDRRTADVRVSTTAPEATLMPHGGSTRLGYQDHDVVDGGRARMILTALVAPAEVQETQPALDLLWHVRFRWKLRPQQVTGDTTYGTVANIAALERQGIRASVPLSAVGQRAGKFADQDVAYDAATATDRCPNGQTWRFISQCEATQRRIDAAPAGACAPCPLRTQCTTSKRSRRTGRQVAEAYLDRGRG
jgi:hypothetical protein